MGQPAAQTPKPKPTFGLTGGIASGKSTVGRLFAELGVPVVDADQLARDVVAPGSEGLAEIVRAFGPTYLDDEGALDRKKLGSMVFADEAARRILEGITHPRIAVAGKEAIAAHQDTDAPFLLYEAPLLVEIGLYRAFPALVVVSLEPARQLERLMAREQCSESDAQARIDSQLPLAEKVKVADFVIDNGGTPQETERQVRAIHGELSRRAAESSP
jgi:dephospho-CoA kinase